MGVLKDIYWAISVLLHLLLKHATESDKRVMWLGMEVNWEAIAGIISCFVSAGAAIAVIWHERKLSAKALKQAISDAEASQKLTLAALEQANETARNSLRPLLNIVKIEGKDEKGLIGFILENNGVGPAIIINIQWSINDKVKNFNIGDFLEIKTKCLYISKYDSETTKPLFIYKTVQRDLFPEDVIPINAKIELLQISEIIAKVDGENSDVHKDKLWEIYQEELRKVKIQITYKSIYEDEFICNYPTKRSQSPKVLK